MIGARVRDRDRDQRLEMRLRARRRRRPRRWGLRSIGRGRRGVRRRWIVEEGVMIDVSNFLSFSHFQSTPDYITLSIDCVEVTVTNPIQAPPPPQITTTTATIAATIRRTTLIRILLSGRLEELATLLKPRHHSQHHLWLLRRGLSTSRLPRLRLAQRRLEIHI